MQTVKTFKSAINLLITFSLTFLFFQKANAQCSELTITELENICNYSYSELESFVSKKGYKIAETTIKTRTSVVLCDQDSKKGFMVQVQEELKFFKQSSINAENFIKKIKLKGYKVFAYDGKVDNTFRIYKSLKYSVYIIQDTENDKNFTIEIKKSKAEEVSNTSENDSEPAPEKVFAKQINSNKLEIDSYTNTTNINIKKGDKINIGASGSVTYGAWAGSSGPDGIDGYTSYNRIQGFRHGSLLVRIGHNGEWEAVGTSISIVYKSSGVLQFIVNDGDPSNNSGSFTVDIKITK